MCVSRASRSIGVPTVSGKMCPTRSEIGRPWPHYRLIEPRHGSIEQGPDFAAPWVEHKHQMSHIETLARSLRFDDVRVQKCVAICRPIGRDVGCVRLQDGVSPVRRYQEGSISDNWSAIAIFKAAPRTCWTNSSLSARSSSWVSLHSLRKKVRRTPGSEPPPRSLASRVADVTIAAEPPHTRWSCRLS